jgi:biopolymer transport protein ExbB
MENETQAAVGAAGDAMASAGDFSIAQFVSTAGIAGYSLVIAAIILFVIGTERFMKFYLVYAGNVRSEMEAIRNYILKREYTSALQVCDTRARLPAMQVVKAGLLAAENGREAMRSALGAALLEATHKVEARLTYIALIANLGTLFGLMGTITGLIKTFAGVAKIDAATKAALLSSGIAEALNSTVFGLVVGIAAMVIHSVLSSQSDSIIASAQDNGLKLITWVEQSERAAANG